MVLSTIGELPWVVKPKSHREYLQDSLQGCNTSNHISSDSILFQSWHGRSWSLFPPDGTPPREEDATFQPNNWAATYRVLQHSLLHFHVWLVCATPAPTFKNNSKSSCVNKLHLSMRTMYPVEKENWTQELEYRAQQAAQAGADHWALYSISSV